MNLRRKRKGRRRKILYLVVTVAIISAMTFLLLTLVPIGKYVQVIASTTPNTVDMDCSLKDIYLLGSSEIESTAATGDRLITVEVFRDQDSLFATIERANVTNLIGYYVIASPALPAEVSLNSELRVVIQMFDSTGSLLAEDEQTILHK